MTEPTMIEARSVFRYECGFADFVEGAPPAPADLVPDPLVVRWKSCIIDGVLAIEVVRIMTIESPPFPDLGANEEQYKAIGATGPDSMFFMRYRDEFGEIKGVAYYDFEEVFTLPVDGDFGESGLAVFKFVLLGITDVESAPATPEYLRSV